MRSDSFIKLLFSTPNERAKYCLKHLADKNPDKTLDEKNSYLIKKHLDFLLIDTEAFKFSNTLFSKPLDEWCKEQFIKCRTKSLQELERLENIYNSDEGSLVSLEDISEFHIISNH